MYRLRQLHLSGKAAPLHRWIASPHQKRDAGCLSPTQTKASPTTANVPIEVEAKLKAPQAQPETPNQMIINIPPGAKQVFLTFA